MIVLCPAHPKQPVYVSGVSLYELRNRLKYEISGYILTRITTERVLWCFTSKALTQCEWEEMSCGKEMYLYHK